MSHPHHRTRRTRTSAAASLRARACAALLATAAAAVQGADGPATPGAEGAAATAPALPLWEAGVFAFGARQPAYPGARQQVGVGAALPWVIYRGRVLRADESTVGLRALRTERAELDLGFAGAFGSRAGEADARRGMPAIGTLVEFGPRLNLRLGDTAAPRRDAEAAAGGSWRVQLPLRGVFDVSDGFADRGLAFEPELDWRLRRGDWTAGASIGLLFGDQRLARTFYGVAPAFATAARPAYEAQAGLIATRLSLSASRRFGPDWRVFGFVRLDSVAGAANRASPLVERDRSLAWGVGVSTTLARSRRTAVD
jgi:outer membrane scaffolding protein for murein synthesis (MipA/OmpV family)